METLFKNRNPNLKSTMVNRGCNLCVFFLSLFLLCFGLAAVIGSIILHYDSTTCQKFSESFLLILASAYVAISLLGLIVLYCHNAFGRGLYLFVMVLFILCVAAFLLVLAIAVTGIGIKGARLSDYLNRLQNDVAADKNWAGIKSCLVDSQFCDSFTDHHVYVQPTSATILEKDLTPLMFACCSPPEGCGYDIKNSTIREVEGSGDCKEWSSNANQLCYDCSSCKARYLDKNIKQPWRRTLVFYIYSLVFLIVVSCVGFCVESNVKHRQSKRGSV